MIHRMTVLGIDPGTAITGFGVVRREANRVVAVEYGVIRTSPDDDPPERLLQIYQGLSNLIDQHQPDAIATERLFFQRNVTTAFSVGRTIGIVLLLAAQRKIPWTEYTPKQVKQAVVGYGAAEKHQVQYMIQRLLGLENIPRPDDAADALAIAVCHAHSILRG